MKPCEQNNYFFKIITFLLSSEISVVFNISTAHSNTNLPIRRLLHEKFLRSKYLPILHALLYSI